MVVDVGMNQDELEEFCNYFKIQIPEVVKSDDYSVQIKVTSYVYKLLTDDGQAIWPEGGLF